MNSRRSEVSGIIVRCSSFNGCTHPKNESRRLASIWVGVPGVSGFMEDRNWDWISGNGEYVTYSISDNNIRGSLFTDLNAGVSILRNDTLIMNILLGFCFSQHDLFSTDTWAE